MFLYIETGKGKVKVNIMPRKYLKFLGAYGTL